VLAHPASNQASSELELIGDDLKTGFTLRTSSC
jgi:hypothetical protein